ncbi:hypothetical protein NEOLEDRAFT_1164542 [Neolentinus lepideus HHB14362 ss-1]|uniref:Bromodomain-containing protein n=1 Tax=Neolentinus lepideus HHB14362 ss-1 TaxID=1314782 RepID=A0A165PVM6_9AGAM|nr:hypothetical protein NEOLEDRAFT_1164542 [Neolentinus lepideus HHB14362 ss-1]
MAHGASSGPGALPKPSFVRVLEDVSTQPTGVHDQQARSYGYNDFSEFKRPEHYIRHIEPLESELAVQVEYDMDEQDQEWLDAVNADRRKEQLDKVSYEVFEVIMDRLEKEWFDLTKNIPKPDMALPSEDSTCAICDDSEGENSNAIVFCDGCNLAVHQDCYGVPYIPEGQWLCRKCTVSPENPVSCILCPNEGGAFKQTVHGDWVHLLCAIWVPETRVVNDVFMEPITGVDKIPKQRWKLKCSICDIREGACIQCNKATCFLAFHPTCARKEKFLMPMKSTQGTEPATLQCFCEKHLPREQWEARKTALVAEPSTPEPGDDRRAAKSARAYAKTYKLGPPLVPAIIVERIMQYINKVNVRKKQDFVYMVCKYWSLKREARRGAPLLKRLHLEPWTASAGGRVQTDEEKSIKLEYMKRLREDLDIVRMLADMCRRRESRKLQQAELINDLISRCLYPHEAPLRLAFERIMGFDRHDFFKTPVSRNDVPDYFDIVQRPMCWSIIDDKLDKHEYWNLQDLKDDINLVLDNAMLYNKSDTVYHKAASRIKANAQPILEELDKQATSHWAEIANIDGGDIDLRSPIGDLEPPLSTLDLLFSADHIKDDINFILESAPLVSLLNYEFEKLKPPPPPPPMPPPKPKKQKKRPRNEPDADAVDASPGFPAPRTRRALAAAAAFEAEARGETDASQNSEVAPTPEPQPEVLPAPTAPEKPAKAKRAQPKTPYSEIPTVVNDVDSRESFKKFEQGWILPPDVRRGGRAPVQRAPLPPPKKKNRPSTSKSQLSVAATSSAENETLHEQSVSQTGDTTESITSALPPPEDEAPVDASDNVNQPNQVAYEAVHNPTARDMEASSPLTAGPDEHEHETMEVDIRSELEAAEIHAASNEAIEILNTPVVTADVFEAPTETTEIPENPPEIPDHEKTLEQDAEEKLDEVAPAPLRAIIIEVLDTPATRREKAMQKKFERMQREEAARVTARVQSEHGSSTAPMSTKPEDAEASELSDLSELESEDEEVETEAQKAEDRRKAEEEKRVKEERKDKWKTEAGAIVLDDHEYLEGGTLDSFPWWAAVVFEPDDPSIPKAVQREKQNVKRTMGGPLHLVRFYDSKSSWIWLELDKLRYLRENNALDEEFLQGSSRQRFRTKGLRAECRAAYRRAMAEMEQGDEEETRTETDGIGRTATPTTQPEGDGDAVMTDL